jgi:N-acetylglucosaminyl-diphospho-decaprenol L-rhamnosyltransferase
MDLSIIIINWNTRDLLAHCLESVYANPPNSELEVIVVDNHSSDASAAMVRTSFPQVRLFENAENVGFVRANNQALLKCRGRYVMLLNSDTIVKPDALTRMVSFLDEHPEAGIVGASVLNPDGTPQRCFGSFPTILSESAYAWGLDSSPLCSKWLVPAPLHSDECRQTDWVLGAALMVRRAALDRVGYLDEEYFMYSEEIDLCHRVKKDGWTNYVLAAAPIIHLGGQSAQQIPAPMKAELFRSKVKYFRKHRGRLAAAFMHSVFALSILARRAAYRLRGRKQTVGLWTDVWSYFVRKESHHDLALAQPGTVSD